MDNDTVAVYWDFENLHASLFDAKNGSGSYGKKQVRGKQQDILVDVQTLYDFAATYGNVAINKAYCNWQWYDILCLRVQLNSYKYFRQVLPRKMEPI